IVAPGAGQAGDVAGHRRLVRSGQAQRLLDQVQDHIVERPALAARQFLDAFGYAVIDVADQEVSQGWTLESKHLKQDIPRRARRNLNRIEPVAARVHSASSASVTNTR